MSKKNRLTGLDLADVSEVEQLESDLHNETDREITESDSGEVTPSIIIEHVNLAADIDRRAAIFTVKIGVIRINGVAIWRSPHGKLRVYFPSFNFGPTREEVIELPPELRTEVESRILATFREAKKKQKAEEKVLEKAQTQREMANANDHRNSE